MGAELNEVLLILNTEEALASLMGSTQIKAGASASLTLASPHLGSPSLTTFTKWATPSRGPPRSRLALSPTRWGSTSRSPPGQSAGRSRAPASREARARPPATPTPSRAAPSRALPSTAQCSSRATGSTTPSMAVRRGPRPPRPAPPRQRTPVGGAPCPAAAVLTRAAACAPRLPPSPDPASATQLLSGKIPPPRAAEPLYRALRTHSSEFAP